MIAKLARFSLIPFTRTLKVKPAFRQVRQGLKPLPQSTSPLKRTDELFSPLQRTLALRQGIHSLADCGTERGIAPHPSPPPAPIPKIL